MEKELKEHVQGLYEFLNSLSYEDIISLVRTVTDNILKKYPESKEENIQLILRHSQSIRSILSRKTVTKELLFKYIDSKKIVAAQPINKENLITILLNYWSQKSTNQISNVATNEPKDDTINLLALKFSEWFYSLFNSNDKIGEEHFWPDASIIINFKYNDNVESQNVVSNGLEVSKLLLMTKINHKLFLNPNLNNIGVQGRMDSHGFVMVVACGIVHKDNSLWGMFEQMFQLIRDPSCENNWKIKNTQLNLNQNKSIDQSLPHGLICN